MLIDIPVDGEIIGILFIPPAVIEDKITVIVFLLVVLEIRINGGFAEEGKTQSGQNCIAIIIPVAPIGGIVVVEVTYSEEASIFKEEKILSYTKQVIDAIPVGSVVDNTVVKVLILKSIVYLGEKVRVHPETERGGDAV